MLWHIIKRELYDHLISLRFALTIGLTILLMVLNAIFFVSSDYQQRLDEYYKNITLVIDAVRANSKHLNDLAANGPIGLYKRPSPLSFCANDQDDTLPMRIHAGYRGAQDTGDEKERSYSWNYPWQLQYVQDIYQKNSMLQRLVSLDWAFIIGVVMSFVAFLFTFDAISGEREHGMLALTLSNPVPRGILLLGKFLAAFITIAVPMLIGMMLSILIVMLSGIVSFSADDLARLCLMGIISLIYITLFIGLGLAVSSHAERSSTSLLALITIWVIMVVIVPNTLGSRISALRKTPSQYEVKQRKNAAIEALNDSSGISNRKIFKYGSPTQPNPDRKAIELWGKYITTKLDIESRFDDEYLDAQFAQVQFARQILRVSPTTIYNYVMESLAGTGFARHRLFVDSARRYRGQFIEFIKATDRTDPESFHVYYLKEGLSSKPVNFLNVPNFVEPAGVGVAIRNALMDLSLLIMLSVLLFLASYIAFLRCDTRTTG